jgi:hypothetical protein
MAGGESDLADSVTPSPALPHFGERRFFKSNALIAEMGEGAGGGSSVDSISQTPIARRRVSIRRTRPA